MLLEDHEIEELMYLLTPTRLEYKSLRKKVQEAIKDGRIDTKEKKSGGKKARRL